MYQRTCLSGCVIWAQAQEENKIFFSEMANLPTASEALFGELNRWKWQAEKGC